MAYVSRQTDTVTRSTDDDYVEEKPVVRRDDTAAPASVAARVIYLIGGIIIALLSFRFLLSLLGANRENTFASLIYGLSYPFAAPFFGLFNYQPQFGVVRFEFETLVAIMFWAFVTWGLVRIATLSSRNRGV